MKPKQFVVLVTAAWMSAPATSACPAETAARIGGQQGYARDKLAAIEIEKRESASSETLGKCIGGITSVVTVPAFPSLADILTRAGDKICRVATDKLREAVAIPGMHVPGLPTTSIPVTVVPPPALPRPATPPASFWERVWR